MWLPYGPLGANRKYVILTLLLLAALYALVPQLGEFRSSWGLLRHPDAVWTGTAIIFTVATYFAAAMTYLLLAFKPLVYSRTVVVELAATFINRLLPAGIGALGFNYAYLRRMRHTGTQAASVVAVNNLLGVVGHLLLLVASLAILPNHSFGALQHDHSLHIVVGFAVVGLVTIVVIAVIFGKQHLEKAITAILRNLAHYWKRPYSLILALLNSMFLTACNVLCLWCSATAVGIHVPLIAALLIFSFGVTAGTATPTPGGLGGFEAGLTAGFIAYHAGTPSALAAALLYRLVSYWLPLLAGVPALIACQRHGWFLADAG